MMAIHSSWLAALPLVLRLVPRNLPRRPQDHALAGAGSPGLRATRGRSSGELAVLGPLSWPRESALTETRQQNAEEAHRARAGHAGAQRETLEDLDVDLGS